MDADACFTGSRSILKNCLNDQDGKRFVVVSIGPGQTGPFYFAPDLCESVYSIRGKGIIPAEFFGSV